MDEFEMRLQLIEAKIDILLEQPSRVCTCGDTVKPRTWKLNRGQLEAVVVCACGMVQHFEHPVR